jgi:hypothetical protein
VGAENLWKVARSPVPDALAQLDLMAFRRPPCFCDTSVKSSDLPARFGMSPLLLCNTSRMCSHNFSARSLQGVPRHPTLPTLSWLDSPFAYVCSRPPSFSQWSTTSNFGTPMLQMRWNMYQWKGVGCWKSLIRSRCISQRVVCLTRYSSHQGPERRQIKDRELTDEEIPKWTREVRRVPLSYSSLCSTIFLQKE